MNEEILNYFVLTEFPRTKAYNAIQQEVRARYKELNEEEVCEHEPYWNDLSVELVRFLADVIKQNLPTRL